MLARSVACLVASTFLFGDQAGDPTAPVIAALRVTNYAARVADAALKQAPRDTRLWTLQGLAMARSGDAQRAAMSYKHALQLAPDYLPALEGDAVLFLKKIAASHPEDKTSHAMLGPSLSRKEIVSLRPRISRRGNPSSTPKSAG